MNLENVLGIIIYKDGKSHSFGQSKTDRVSFLTDSNFHDYAFNNEILTSEWFRETGYNYDKSNNIHFNTSYMCGYGFIVILNASDYVNNYICYSVNMPESEYLSDEERNYMISIYNY